jgi:Fe-S-cluster containining protein
LKDPTVAVDSRAGRCHLSAMSRPLNLCNRCGACCRVLVLEQTPAEVQAMAALTTVLGIPSDHAFAAKHWHPLSRAEAMARNPFYTSHLPADANLYRCDQLGADGRCEAYERRPFVCRGYPWYGGEAREMPLADARCGYAYDVIEEKVMCRPET